MTVSFHEYEEDFFPGTGNIEEIGDGVGKFFTVNIPLKRGMDDVSYQELFQKVMERIMSSYRPDAVVIQCGADSLARDKLGHFNMSIKGHA
jgi:histone deacetylase 1/2